MDSRIQKNIDLLDALKSYLDAGNTVALALAETEKIVENKAEQKLYANLSKRVNQGAYLYTALAAHGSRFDPIIRNLIKIGETSGNLAESISYAVSLLKKRQLLLQKVRSAAIYPSFILASLLFLGLIVGFVVLPKLLPLFTNLAVDLPLSTKVLLGGINFLTEYPFIVVFSTLAIGMIMAISLATARIRHFLYLKTPFIRKFSRAALLLEQFHNLNSLLQSNIPLFDAAQAIQATTTNTYYAQAWQGITQQLSQGANLFQALNKYSKLFPKRYVNLIRNAERNGSMPAATQTIVSQLEAKVDQQARNLTIALEPLLLIFVGGILLFVAVAIISPIYNLTATF